MSQDTAQSAGQPARIDRARLDAARFPSTFELQIRFDDLDVQWHVNNAAVITMLQEARVIFNRSTALPKLEGGKRTVVGAMAIEFAAEINYPGTVEIVTGVAKLGRSSFTVAQIVRQNGRGAVYSLITMIVSDANGAVPIPDDYRAALEARAMIA